MTNFDANDWFANRTIGPPGGNAPKTPLSGTTIGYNLAALIYIPGHYNTSKDKTFFFWSENWRRYRQGSVISAGVPSLREREGDFSECDPESANHNAVVASGCTLPVVNGTTVDSVAVDPDAKALLNSYIPLPDNGVVGYTAAPSLPTNWRQEQIRVDENVSEKVAVFVRFTNDGYQNTQTPSAWSGSSYDTVATTFNAPGKNGVIHLTQNFKPNLMNEFIAGYSGLKYTLRPAVGASSPSGSFTKPSDWTMGSIYAPKQLVHNHNASLDHYICISVVEFHSA